MISTDVTVLKYRRREAGKWHAAVSIWGRQVWLRVGLGRFLQSWTHNGVVRLTKPDTVPRTKLSSYLHSSAAQLLNITQPYMESLLQIGARLHLRLFYMHLFFAIPYNSLVFTLIYTEQEKCLFLHLFFATATQKFRVCYDSVATCDGRY
jgi:hypothetical protein